MMSKDEVIEIVEHQIEDNEYRLERARAPKQKRGIKHSLAFFKAVKHHLTHPGG